MLMSASPGRGGGDGAGAGRAQRATGSSPTIANSAAPTVVQAPACSRSRFSGWISGWRGGALYPLAVAADRRRRFIFYGSAMAERRRGCGWPPAPPRRHFGSRCCARSGIAPRQPFSATSRAREARGADSRSRFHFLVSAARPSRRRRARTALAEPTVPPALPPSYAATAAGRRCLRSAVGAPRQPFSATSRAREARGADSRSRFHFLVSAARPSRRRRARTALAEPTVPPALPPSYAVTAAGRRCLRSAVGASASTISVTLTRARGARRRFQIAVSFFSFSGATPAMPRLAALAADGAGGGAQSRPSDAEAAEGRPRLCSAVGAPRQPFPLPSRARARRQAPIPDRGFIF